MRNQSRELFACGLWVAALALMAFGSLDTERAGRNSPFLAWGVFVSVLACVPTGWCIVKREAAKREDETVDHIIEVVDALHEGRRELTRLR